jgi:hypothetical protein
MGTQTKEEKEYVSLRFAQGDIEEAIRLLNRARTETDTEIQFVIVKYCIIAYARPFNKSRDVFGKKFNPLKKKLVFPGGNSFHDQLIDDRNQYIAHVDLKAHNPKLYFPPERNIFPIGLTPSHLYDQIDMLIDKMLTVCDFVLKYLVARMTTLETLFRE